MESGTRGQLDLATFARLRDYFSREKPVPAGYLFGSRASGRFSANSDVDVAVILPPGLNSEDAFWECAAIAPESNRDVFQVLAEHEVLPRPLFDSLLKMASFFLGRIPSHQR